jgi:hypothetical protein
MLAVAVRGQGSFVVEQEQVIEYADRCGIRPPNTIKYRVVVEGEVADSGFVIEIQEIPRYFQRLYEEQRRSLHSCERVAVDACEFFAKQGFDVRRVYVEIEANTNTIGFASAEWIPDTSAARRRVQAARHNGGEVKEA